MCTHASITNRTFKCGLHHLLYALCSLIFNLEPSGPLFLKVTVSLMRTGSNYIDMILTVINTFFETYKSTYSVFMSYVSSHGPGS